MVLSRLLVSSSIYVHIGLHVQLLLRLVFSFVFNIFSTWVGIRNVVRNFCICFVKKSYSCRVVSSF